MARLLLLQGALRSELSTGEFALRVAAGAAIVSAFALVTIGLFLNPAVPLLLFAAVLAAVFLDAASGPLRARMGLPRGPSVVLLVACLLGLTAVGVTFSGPRLVQQMGELEERMPRALERVEARLASIGLADLMSERDGSSEDESRMMDMVSRAVAPATRAVGAAAAGLAAAGVVAILGFFLALQPQLYLRSLLRLAPPRRRNGASSLVASLGHALRWWLVGRLLSMSAVGVLTLAGLLALGVPLALLLSVIAALLSFIPYLGPLLAAAPAVLLAFSVDTSTMLWVAGLYTGVQIIENNLVTPLVQQRVVSLPPAALIAAQLVMGALFGFLGILCATPLAVAIVVVVQKVYIEEVLGEEIQVIGEGGDGPGPGMMGAGARSDDAADAPGGSLPSRSPRDAPTRRGGERAVAPPRRLSSEEP